MWRLTPLQIGKKVNKKKTKTKRLIAVQLTEFTFLPHASFEILLLQRGLKGESSDALAEYNTRKIEV